MFSTNGTESYHLRQVSDKPLWVDAKEQLLQIVVQYLGIAFPYNKCL